MSINVRDTRRGNLKWLINITPGGQSSLAKALGHIPTQQRLSDIQLNKKRSMSELEARKIEQFFVIPVGWMDRENWLRDGWELIKKYQKIGEEQRTIVSSLSTFILERLSVDIS